MAINNAGVSPNDVYSATEIAQAAGVPPARVEALVAEGRIRPVSHGLGGGVFRSRAGRRGRPIATRGWGPKRRELVRQPAGLRARVAAPPGGGLERIPRGRRRVAHFDQHDRGASSRRERTRPVGARSDAPCIHRDAWSWRRWRWGRPSPESTTASRAAQGQSHRSTAHFPFGKHRSQSRRHLSRNHRRRHRL